jgi:peptidyl-prolyl cis-trans isomerase SurA
VAFAQVIHFHSMKPLAMTPLFSRTLQLTWLGLAMAGSVQAQGLKPSARLLGPATQAAIAQASGPVAADYIVAVVNNEPITNHEVSQRLAQLEQQAARNGSTMPPRDQAAKQVLESLIQQRAQLQLASEMGIRIEASALDEAERGVARQNQLTVAQMHDQLKSQGLSLDEFRTNLRQQLTLQRLREREVESRVRVSEADIDRFVAQKLDNPGADLQLHLAQILVAVPEAADAVRVATLMSRAQMVAEKARSGADFTALAREYSDAPDRASGGDLGLRGAERYPDLFVTATRSVPAGSVAGPVRSPAGFHVLKVVEKRVAGMPDATVTQTHARHILLRPTAQRSEAAALAQLAELKQRIESGSADFAAMAKEFSQDGSSAQGGDLGWTPPGVFVPEFEEVMNALSPNQISAPVASRFGAHLIQVLGRRQVELSARERRDQLRQLVREQKLDEAYVQWLDEIRSRAYVELREPPR